MPTGSSSPSAACTPAASRAARATPPRASRRGGPGARDAIEAVRDGRAGMAASPVVRSEHEVVDEELRAPAEEVGQRSVPFIGLKSIRLVDPDPRQLLPPLRQFVAAPRKLLLPLEQRAPRRKPCFACSDLVCRHGLSLLSPSVVR